jgi:hypothetical protein
MRDWEQCYQKGETPWDRGEAAPPLLELLDHLGLGLWGGGPVLVPGCGVGHDVRALAASGIVALGLDLAATAVTRAREFPPAGDERYETGDFLDPAWRQGRSFAALWEHTCFCAINPALRPRYAAAAGELLEPGAVLAGVFYLEPDKPGESHDGPPFGATVAELDATFAPWFVREHGWVPERAYRGRAGREWLAVYRRRLTPDTPR